ncbi:hypothetical protein ACLB2K_003373 [Fragaria x ananassa]
MVIQTTSMPIFDAILQLDVACSHDPEAQRILATLTSNSGPKHFEDRQGRLYYKGKIYVPETSEWRAQILHEFHGFLQAGHSGYLKTLVRLQRNFSWPGIRKDVKLYVTSCDHCQRQKYESIRPLGLLQPLPILAHNWEDISMDFVKGLPKSNGFNAIMVIVDRLSKFTHFVIVAHPFSAADIVDIFLRNIFRLHGMPKRIVSDRDPVFVSKFWIAFFKLNGKTLCHSSAYHPQSDGQSEVVNRTLEQYLRCFIMDKPNSWAILLHWVEWWTNTTYHSTIHMTSFQALHRHPPPTIEAYLPGTTTIAAIDKALQDRDILIEHLRTNMAKAQNRMKQMADKNRTKREFAEGGWVFLKLQTYRQKSLLKRLSTKLAPRFFGPFKIQ